DTDSANPDPLFGEPGRHPSVGRVGRRDRGDGHDKSHSGQYDAERAFDAHGTPWWSCAARCRLRPQNGTAALADKMWTKSVRAGVADPAGMAEIPYRSQVAFSDFTAT